MRKGAYAMTSVNTSVPDDVSSELAIIDLRQHVRRLLLHPVLSKEWYRGFVSLANITKVAVLEHTSHKDGAVGCSLWDNKAMGVRLLMEEGKTNLVSSYGWVG
jgi:hypothetical protein